ncbi:hypothetical protein HELRODRAFT_190817 [Helobdella robusta]|uniref:Nicastrin n=1 Tax=Helobdella robusta TaxID=6412 RepID=T1FSB4_HELRO|nr:hypothetical protein HELRODRAFT_190817 [Helobdella robusta]ESO07932.1 hypothetical protein HELRODRAFT_190817 [Helobdella robusta]
MQSANNLLFQHSFGINLTRRDLMTSWHELISDVIVYNVKRDDFSICMKFLNSTDQMGCSGDYGGNTGVLMTVSSEKDLDWLRQPGHEKNYIILMGLDFLESRIIEEFIDIEKIVGVLIDVTTPHQTAFFSPDLSSPNYEQSIYTRNFDWNMVGNGLLFMDIPFPMALLHNNETVKIMRDCYLNHNKRLMGGCYMACPLCAVKMNMAMNADTSSRVCLRRELLPNDVFNVYRFCDTLAGYSYLASLTPWGGFPKDSVTIIAARLDALSLFETRSPGAVSTVTGLVTLYAIASILSKVVDGNQAEFKSKPVVFALFNGESLTYMGSSRIVHDLMKDAHKFLSLEQISTIIEMGHLGRPEVYRSVLPPKNKTLRDVGRGANLQDLIKSAGEMRKPIAQFTGPPVPSPTNATNETKEERPFVPTPTNQSDADINEAFSDVAYIHGDISYPEESKDKVLALINKFMTEQQDKRVVLRRSTMNKLPPSSIHAFLKKKQSIVGLVVANHDKSYDNLFHNSFLDTPEQHNWYEKKWSELDKYNKITENVQYMASVATTVACVVFREVTGKTACAPTMAADQKMIANLLYCFTQDPECELFKSIVPQRFLEFISDPERKSYFTNRFIYQEVELEPFYTQIHNYVFAHVIGKPLDEKECEVVKKGSKKDPLEPVKILTNGFNNTELNKRVPECKSLYINVIRTGSPLLDPVLQSNADLVVSVDFPTWTLSTFNDKHISIKVFLLPCSAQEIKTLLLGIGVVLFFIPMTAFVKKKLLIAPRLDH